MLTLLASAIAIAIAARLGAIACRRLPQSARDEIAKTIRHLRLRGGRYSLKLLMRRMIDDMLESVLPSISRSYVPNAMRFGLHPGDAQRWGMYFPELERELRSLMLAQIAERDDLHLQGELKVTVVADDAASPGRPTFQASMTRASRAAQPTQVMRDGSTEIGSAGVATKLVEPGGRGAWSIAIEDMAPVALLGEMTVGRGPGADIRIERDEVSRAHARLAVSDGHVTIVDLDSSNGTRVNARPVKTAMLESGDLICFGGNASATLHRRTTAE